VAQLDIKIYLVAPLAKNGPVAQLNSALDFGSSGYKFESCQGHSKPPFKGGFFVSLKIQTIFFLSIFFINMANL
jgi:hypothetical protein